MKEEQTASSLEQSKGQQRKEDSRERTSAGSQRTIRQKIMAKENRWKSIDSTLKKKSDEKKTISASTVAKKVTMLQIVDNQKRDRVAEDSKTILHTTKERKRIFKEIDKEESRKLKYESSKAQTKKKPRKRELKFEAYLQRITKTTNQKTSCTLLSK